MKKILLISCFCISFLGLAAQVNDTNKPSSLAFHLFYNDFKTAQQIKASSIGNILKNGNWSSIRDMQMGFGFDYIKGINQTFDLTGTLDGSGINYLFKDGTVNGSSKFLLDIHVGANVKLLNNRHAVVPYFSGGTGFSYYNRKSGIFFPAGIGAQFNLFNEAFVVTNLQYRFAATGFVNDHFYYAVGIGLPVGRKRKPAPIAEETTPVAIQPVEVKIINKDLRIKVTDEQTGTALAAANVTVTGSNSEFKAITNAGGEVVFSSISAGSYEIRGMLNGVSTTVQALQASSFNSWEQEILITLSHHDPRFTLTGMVEEKGTNKPVGGAVINIFNRTKETKEIMQNNMDGTFKLQLAGESDYIFSAKKANYMSDIDSVTTKGLNRSATLYVVLSLGVEEARQNNSITLRNIYYQTGSIFINQHASSDLDKLILFLTDNPGITMEIASHSDSRGDAAKNLLLSQRRAQEVVNYLQKHGIRGIRLIAKGYGETRLINGCKDGVKCSEAQHEQNRRTEFKVINN